MKEKSVWIISLGFLAASILATILTVFVSVIWFWLIFLFIFIGIMLAFSLVIGHEMAIVLVTIGMGAGILGTISQTLSITERTSLTFGLMLFSIGLVYYGYILAQFSSAVKKEKQDKIEQGTVKCNV